MIGESMRRRKTRKTGRRVLVDSNQNRACHFLHWHTALLSLFLLEKGAFKAKCKGVIFFDLHPTAVLASQRRRRRRRRLLNCDKQTNSSCSSTYNQSVEEEKWWFHPNSNAVYATIPKKEDMFEDGFESDDLLHDFHRFRHLSRHERQYRMQLGLDLQPDWDGIYDYDTDFEDDDEELHVNATYTNATNKQAQRLLRQTVTSSVHSGGRFNNYQGVSLSQGYGTHYANAWVGSPTPQRKTLIVDTGSHYTAFPCTGCRNCGLQHHTDPYFNPQKSNTFHVLQCNECREGVTCQDNRCIFSQSYTEGSSWEAYQVRDKFYCGGSDFLGAVDPDHQKYAIDFMFGCQLSLNG
jgi:Xylanase inhibitor N-terminal